MNKQKRDEHCVHPFFVSYLLNYSRSCTVNGRHILYINTFFVGSSIFALRLINLLRFFGFPGLIFIVPILIAIFHGFNFK